ncbi:Fusaric acid resistance protein-like [Bacillus sp. OV322]|uniref:FUSC family protein n=1 Tax=Bacillus sp. OV322 TaxID=1882764 RepID=UPI0008F1036C|nr:FUSC family protein [Bacillus sp. OV322]SFC95021.1 Fusaric acid resistance protein-like [Bacillus sp. OV322]
MKTTKNETQSENSSILIWKLAIGGSTLSWEIAKLCGSFHPYLAPLSVIISLRSTMDKTVRLSIKWVIGTIIGIFVTVLIASHMTVIAWNLGLLILLGCFAAKYLNLDKKVIHQVALTILFVFVFEHQTKHYAIDRMRDTLIGVLVTGIIQLIWFRLILRSTRKIPESE